MGLDSLLGTGGRLNLTRWRLSLHIERQAGLAHLEIAFDEKLNNY